MTVKVKLWDEVSVPTEGVRGRIVAMSRQWCIVAVEDDIFTDEHAVRWNQVVVEVEPDKVASLLQEREVEP
jgi:hypothetical protein